MAEKQALPDPIWIKDGQIILHKVRFRKTHYSAGKINKIWYAQLNISRGVRKKISTQTTNLKEAKEMANVITNFKMLDGSKGITSISLKDSDEEVLIVSQFTLAAVTNRGSKPSFHRAAKHEDAKLMYDKFVNEFKKIFPNVKEGKFGSYMEIALVNKGPVTFNFKT